MLNKLWTPNEIMDNNHDKSATLGIIFTVPLLACKSTLIQILSYHVKGGP